MSDKNAELIVIGTGEKEKDQIEDNQAEDNLVFELSKEYTFEGVSYHDVDIRMLRDLTASDMIAVNRILSRSGNTDFLQEMTLEYACVLASRGSDLPMEFYKGLPPKDAIKLKSRITGFLYGEE